MMTLKSYHPRAFPIDLGELARRVLLFLVWLLVAAACAGIVGTVFWFPLLEGLIR